MLRSSLLRPSRFRHSAALSLAAAFALTLPVQGRELLGAEAVLKRLAAPSEMGAGPTNPVPELKALFKALVRESAGLSPEVAATRWLALFDAFTRLPSGALSGQGYRERDRLDVAALIQTLPAPEAWDALATAIQSRTETTTAPRELGLRLLGAVIAGDHNARLAAVERLRVAIAEDKKLDDYALSSSRESIERIAAAIAQAAGESAQLAAFTRELEKRESPSTGRRDYSDLSLSIPDLVREVGRAAAEPLLVRALHLNVELRLWSAGGTRRVLAELALREADQLKRPYWDLVGSLDDVALYEALTKKFPTADIDPDRRAATGIYLLGLVAAGRTEDATRLVFAKNSRFDPDLVGYTGRGTLDQLQRAGRGNAVVDFLREVLTRDPALPFWDGYITLSAQQSRAGEALDFLRTCLARTDLPAATLVGLRPRYATALLAADQVEEGLAMLRALVAEDQNVGAAPSDATASLTPEDEETRDELGERAQRVVLLLKLGRLLEKPALIEEGLAASRALLARIGESESYRRAALITASIDTLLALERLPEAEALLADHLVVLQASEKGSYRSQTQETLLKLVALYGRAGRHADVLRLVADSPDLGVSDLAGLSMSSCGEATVSPHLLLADALIATNRAEEARPILRRIVQNQPGCDAAYERLEKLGGSDYVAFLEGATRWDRFEERPLIWKARLQLASGQVEAAEKTIRAAIAIDPSDGEQGKGDRLRAYAVLGDILEKRGDTDQAALMRGAGAAIRLSEQADDWWAAGLLTHAVGLYEQSLLKFADAYCIQSRLALRYSELGDFAKAEQHYRRAFELMPESFGRVESHCFGCEGAFNGPRAQSVAEKVFAELAIRMPDRAQVFYLLGYLRTEQERPGEAADYFRQAVTLDPDYLNAWAKLQSLAGEVALPAREREAIALAILRLDPAGEHAQPMTEGFADLRKLWGTLLEIEAGLPARELGPLFDFPASRAKIEAKRNDSNEFDMSEALSFSEQPLNLRQRLSENALLSATGAFIESTLNR